MTIPRFGLNRFDPRSVDAFAADVKRAEALGWDAAFQPDSQLRRRDTYVFLAAAARATERITLGTLLANPVNRHPSVTASSIEAIRAGAAEAGRDPASVRLGAVFHTVLVDDAARALTMAKSMAAGYYEYSPMLFDRPGLKWTGPDPEALKRDRHVWPDFHHAPDLDASGRVVDFLPSEAADAFALRGGPADIVKQLVDVLRASPAAFDYVVLHPIPNPSWPDDPDRGYTARVAREILPAVRRALGG